MTDYELYLNNMKIYKDNLMKTNIQFIFFLASDLSQPKMRDEFSIMKLGRNKCYIINGIQSNGWHIYKESDLKYLINILNPSQICNGFDIAILNSRTIDSTANHGDHLTFNIIKRKNGDIIVKTHMTFYSDLGNFIFDRTEQSCNFTFLPNNILNLKNHYCERIDGTYLSDTIETIYTPIQQAIIDRLCKAMLGQVGGKNKSKYYKYKNKNYKLYSGKKQGKYIIKNNKKFYIQKGGSFHGITVNSDKFLEFLKTTIFIPLKNNCNDLATIEIIYDENNHFGSDSNKYIVICYDFGDTSLYNRNIFYLDTKKALTACYVDDLLKTYGDNIPTDKKYTVDEKKDYDNYISFIPTSISKIVSLNI